MTDETATDETATDERATDEASLDEAGFDEAGLDATGLDAIDELGPDAPTDAPSDEALDAALLGYDVPAPPAGFADRVMDALDTPATRTSVAPARPRWPYLAVGLAAAAAAAVVLWPGAATQGELVATARAEVALGDRGVAVAEPGAHLTWSVDGSVADVEQRAGDVFYRAEPSDRFVVHTDAGDVSVRGTCFRVEVLDMNVSPQLFVGAAAGALLAGSVIVSVYEGEVEAENEHGAVTLAAGERAVIAAGEAPRAAPRDLASAEGASHDRAGDRAEGADAPAPTDDELAALGADALRDRLRRVSSQSQERAHEIERLRGLLDESGRDSGRVREFFPASPAQLRQWADDCQLRVDYPPVMTLEPGEVGVHAETLDLTPEETAAVQAAINEMHASVNERLSELYVEATGDASGAAYLSSNAMFAGIRDVAGPGEGPGEIMLRIARERAGIVAPPSAEVDQSATERAIRLFSQLGDDFQTRLAQSLGPERAYELRATDNGWPWSHSVFTGCPDAD